MTELMSPKTENNCNWWKLQRAGGVLFWLKDPEIPPQVFTYSHFQAQPAATGWAAA